VTDSAGIPHRNAVWVFESGLALQATQASSKGHKSKRLVERPFAVKVTSVSGNFYR
jgi:hypothetical protein